MDRMRKARQILNESGGFSNISELIEYTKQIDERKHIAEERARDHARKLGRVQEAIEFIGRTNEDL